MNQKVKAPNLTGAWERLEAVCRMLWDENSSCAVEVQAVYEEFKGEVHRAEAQLAATEETRALELREHEENLEAMRRLYEIELSGLKKRIELQENALREKDARSEQILATMARKEEENLEAHSQILRMLASSDEHKAKKMEEFYQEMVQRDATQTDSWQQRHVTLEKENEHRQQVLALRQSELEAWEQRRMNEEQALNKRIAETEFKSQELAQEYRKKQQEIEDLKASLQRSVTELVRQYQARLRAPADPEPARRPT